MNTASVEVREGAGQEPASKNSAWARMGLRAADASKQVAEASASSVHAAPTKSAAMSWWHGGWRALRYAAVGIALLAALPLGTVAMHRREFVRQTEGIRERVQQVDALRSLRVSVDASVTPQAAGEAYARLFPVDARDGFVPRLSVPEQERPAHTLRAIMSPASGTANAQWWGPQHEQIIRRAAAGLSATERDVLRRIAAAPMWETVDRVASAPWADLVGGQYRTPFAPNAQAFAMPIMHYGEGRAITYASVSRAAYYVSLGEYVQAELALRRALSMGFLLIDNGASTFDALVGRMFVGVAYKGLKELAQVRGAQGVLMPLPEIPEITSWGAAELPASTASFDELRAAQLRALADPALPRTLRLASLETLPWSVCGSLKETLFGPSAAARAATAAAVTSLGRTPAERELVRLIARPLDLHEPFREEALFDRAAVGAAQVVSAVTGKPQFAACTRMALAFR